MFRSIVLFTLALAIASAWLFVLKPLPVEVPARTVADEFYRTDLRHDNLSFYEGNCQLRATVRSFDGTFEYTNHLITGVKKVIIVVDMSDYTHHTIPEHLSAHRIGETAFELASSRYLPLITPKTWGCGKPTAEIHYFEDYKPRPSVLAEMGKADNVSIHIRPRATGPAQSRALNLQVNYFRPNISTENAIALMRYNSQAIHIPFDTAPEEAKRKLNYFLSKDMLSLYWTGGFD